MFQFFAVIVAYGFLLDLGPQEMVMQVLAVRVGDYLLGWVLCGVMLVVFGVLDAVLEGLDQLLVYPFFMAEGWFIGIELLWRLDGRGWVVVFFGVEPDLFDLCVCIVVDMLVQWGWQVGDIALLLVVYGSQWSRTSVDSVFVMAEDLCSCIGLWQIICGFVEESSYLADVVKGLGQVICLLFFALCAGHVIEDISQALQEAQFIGVLLPFLGEDVGVFELIACSLQKVVYL